MRITFLSPFPSLAGGIRVNAIYAAHFVGKGREAGEAALAVMQTRERVAA